MVLAELTHPLLVEFRFGEHGRGVLGEFAQIDNNAAQVKGHPLLQQVNTRVSHYGDPLAFL